MNRCFRILFLNCYLAVSFFQANAQVEFTSSNLPIIIVNTNGQPIPDEPKIDAEISIINNGSDERNDLTDPYEYTGKIAIERRGSSSQDLFPKKQYGFELRNEFGEDMDTTLLGMPGEEDWILFAPYDDKSLIRDVLAYKLGNDMSNYAPRTRFCELVLNDEYMGVYVLIEKIKRDKNRVDIAKLNPDEISGDDVTGGYIIKIDKSTGNGGEGWASKYPPNKRGGTQQVFFMYEYPKDSEITPEQKQYIQQYVNDFETTLKSKNFRDPNTGYRNFVDLPSFIDFFLINELTKNVDAYRLSTFFHKQKDSDGGKLVMGPIWDYNLGFGNADYCTQGNPEGFVYRFNQLCPDDWWLVPFWWERFLQDYRFRNQLRVRWDELRQGPFQTQVILDYIDSVANVLDESQQRNFVRWPVLGIYVWPNYYYGDTYDEEIDWLKNWVVNRLNWLDGNIPEYREILGLEDQENSLASVYPNPFSDHLNLELILNKASKAIIRVYNSYGKELSSYQHTFSPGNNEFSIPEIPRTRGVYFLQIEIDGKYWDVFKVIKQ